MKKTLALISFILAAFLAVANAANIAVLEIIIPEALDEDAGEAELTLQETKFLTDELRRQATITLEKEFSVLTREQIIAFASEQPKDSGQVDLCKVLKSNYLTNGSINKLGSLLTLKVDLYDCEKKQSLGDFTGEAPDLKGLMDVIRGNAPKLFKKLVKEEVKEEPKPELKVAVEVTTVPTNIERMQKPSTWVAVGLDILGVSALGFGIYQHVQASNAYSEYEKFKRPNRMEYEYNPAQYDIPYEKKYQKVKDAKTKREAAFIFSGVFLLSGVMVHIWF